MQRMVFVLFITVLLIACGGDKAAIEGAIQANLKDPDSAKFRNLIVSKKGTYACIEWNSRNSFGGYGDWDVARLENVQSGWRVMEMKVPENKMRYCEDIDFIDEIRELTKDIMEN